MHSTRYNQVNNSTKRHCKHPILNISMAQLTLYSNYYGKPSCILAPSTDRTPVSAPPPPVPILQSIGAGGETAGLQESTHTMQGVDVHPTHIESRPSAKEGKTSGRDYFLDCKCTREQLDRLVEGLQSTSLSVSVFSQHSGSGDLSLIPIARIFEH